MSDTLLEVRNLKTWFPIHQGILQRVVNHVHAVDGLSLKVPKGQTVALVGESGCGKTTVGKTIAGLIPSTDGEILFDGANLAGMGNRERMKYRQRIQMIFQDPANSLDPRMLVKDLIGEGLKSFGLAKNKTEYLHKVTAMLDRCGLGEDALYRYPHEFSGGQRQRICIARALVVEPEFIVCDEATSALDVSVQASILNLLKDLQQEMGLTYLFITHDLSVVEYLSDRVAVMYLGQIVEEADAASLFKDPQHPYTQALLHSAPSLDPDHRDLIALGGDIPSPINPPSCCRFHGRCAQKMTRCDTDAPNLYPTSAGTSRCFLHEPKT